MNRGEIWSVAGEVYASKPRPALIVQDDRFDVTASVTVLPMTSVVADALLLRIPIPANDVTGLECLSFIMIDKVTTVRRGNASRRIGRVSTSQTIEVERSMLVFLGLAG